MPVTVMLIPLGFFGLVAFIVWVVVTGFRQRNHTRAMADFNAKLLERISSFKDFSEFLQTDQGARFMDLSLQPRSSNAGDRVIRTTQVGIVLSALGAGLLFMAYQVRSDDAVFIGGVTLSLGVGFLISAVVSYILARSLGVLATPPDDLRRRTVD
jgi:hypothetical protein